MLTTVVVEMSNVKGCYRMNLLIHNAFTRLRISDKFYNMTSETIDSTNSKSNTFSQYIETIVML